jgi:cyclic pyranopterin phosphate synthase
MDVSYLRLFLHGETDGILMAKRRPANLALELPEPAELRDLLQLLADRGACKIRLSGDDPVLREDLHELVALIAGIAGITEVALTTRGIGLQGRVADLARAGLRSVNFDLDTLKPDRYMRLTGTDAFEGVWGALQESLGAGLRVKVNCVLQEGLNVDEIDDFVSLTADQPVEVRFIEWNSAVDRVAPAAEFVPTREALALVKPPLLHREPEPFSGPALRFEAPGHMACIGFIPNLTEHFCGECDRVGMTDFGEIVSCIFGRGLNLLRLLRSPGSIESVDAFVDRVLRRKTSLAAKISGWDAPSPPVIAASAV